MLTIDDLAKLLRPHMDAPLWPGITDPGVKRRAIAHAKRSGLWEKLEHLACPSDVIPTIRFSEFDNYFRTGSREPHASSLMHLFDVTDHAALALWLDHPVASIDWLSDLMWQWCGVDWAYPAHQGLHIELLGTRAGRTLCEYSNLFADRLHPDVRKRVELEVNRRMLDVALDWRKPDRWNTNPNNWNIVCNTDLAQMALYQLKDSLQLATFVHTICRRLDYALAYFTPDGGCVEGPGYWEYGFGHFLNLVIALKERTGGAVDLSDDPHIHAICRYPLAAQLRGEKRASFADAGDAYLSATAALKVNHLLPVPELFRLVRPSADRQLDISDLRGLCLFDGQQFDPTSDDRDYHLQDLQYAKLYGPGEVVLAAVAGRNDVSHNHNDIGSFILMIGDLVALTDPGLPLYNSKTFGPNRYDMLVCRSKGHSVPVVNDFEQSFGPEFCGTLSVQGLNAAGDKKLTVDFAKAYPDPTLTQLKREIEIKSDGRISLIDFFKFSIAPKSIEEAFMTYEPVKISDDKRGIVIGKEGMAVSLHAGQKGTFSIDEYSPPEHEGWNKQTLRRISFRPHVLEKIQTLEFWICRLQKSDPIPNRAIPAVPAM